MNLKLRNSCFFFRKTVGVFRHCLFRCSFFYAFICSCFHFFTFSFLQMFLGVFIDDCICSLHFFFTVRYFVFALLYRECYGFERAYFTPRCFLPYTLSCFYQGFTGAGSSALKVSGLPTEVRNTEPQHQFVWTKQCSTTIW